MIDPDDVLLEAGSGKRQCVAARAINRLTKEQQDKVEAALLQPKRVVTNPNISEYIYRKLNLPEPERFHADSLAKHRRGACGCR